VCIEHASVSITQKSAIPWDESGFKFMTHRSPFIIRQTASRLKNSGATKNGRNATERKNLRHPPTHLGFYEMLLLFLKMENKFMSGNAGNAVITSGSVCLFIERGGRSRQRARRCSHTQHVQCVLCAAANEFCCVLDTSLVMRRPVCPVRPAGRQSIRLKGWNCVPPPVFPARRHDQTEGRSACLIFHLMSHIFHRTAIFDL
jgi:hypothetical protein